METIQKQEFEQVEGEHSSPSVSVEGSVAVAGAEALHSALDSIADSFDVRGFKCSECGLAHMHDTTKHRASDKFDMSEDEAASMDYNPNCHCGVQELGRHGSDFGIDQSEAARTARNAPIPDEASREMNAQFGGL